MTTPNEYTHDYVFAPQMKSTFMQVTESNTGYKNGAYPPLPIGNLFVIITWEGAGAAQFNYLPDGRYANRRPIASINPGVKYEPRKTIITLAVDNPAASILLTTGAGQDLDCRAGVKIIAT